MPDSDPASQDSTSHRLATKRSHVSRGDKGMSTDGVTQKELLLLDVILSLSKDNRNKKQLVLSSPFDRLRVTGKNRALPTPT